MTVKQLKSALKEIKSIYNFDEANTDISLMSRVSLREKLVSIVTIDKATGASVEIRKYIEDEEIKENKK